MHSATRAEERTTMRDNRERFPAIARIRKWNPSNYKTCLKPARARVRLKPVPRRHGCATISSHLFTPVLQRGGWAQGGEGRWVPLSVHDRNAPERGEGALVFLCISWVRVTPLLLWARQQSTGGGLMTNLHYCSNGPPLVRGLPRAARAWLQTAQNASLKHT